MMTKLLPAFSADVLAALATPWEKPAQRSAEVRPEVCPAWYVVETWPDAERDVIKALLSMRFGVYVPELEEVVVKRGRIVRRLQLMFPGYIFVFVWLTEQSFHYLRSTPGVKQMMMDAGKPAQVKDDLIDLVRSVENGERPLPLDTSKRSRRRNYNSQPITVRAWSVFEDGIGALDSQVRNQTLMRALGLCS